MVNSQGQHKHREVDGGFCLISRHKAMKMNGGRADRKKKKNMGKEEWVTAGVWCGSRPCPAVVLVPQSTKDAPRPTSTGSCGAGHIKEDLDKKSYTLCPTGWKLCSCLGSRFDSQLCCSSPTWEKVKPKRISPYLRKRKENRKQKRNKACSQWKQ